MATFENIDQVQFPVPGSLAHSEQEARINGERCIFSMDDIIPSGVPRSVHNPTNKNSDELLGRYLSVETVYGQVHHGKIVSTNPTAIYLKGFGTTIPVLRKQIVKWREI